MNVNMYENPATRYNIGKLHIRGARIVEAGDGYLACGDIRRGRLAEWTTSCRQRWTSWA